MFRVGRLGFGRKGSEYQKKSFNSSSLLTSLFPAWFPGTSVWSSHDQKLLFLRNISAFFFFVILGRLNERMTNSLHCKMKFKCNVISYLTSELKREFNTLAHWPSWLYWFSGVFPSINSVETLKLLFRFSTSSWRILPLRPTHLTCLKEKKKRFKLFELFEIDQSIFIFNLESIQTEKRTIKNSITRGKIINRLNHN